MRRTFVAGLCLVTAGLGVTGLGALAPAAEAVPPSARSLAVSGTDVTMYPAFAADTMRYAATTTAAAGGALTVTAAPAGSGDVLVNGWPATSTSTTVSGLTAGDEVSVIFDDAEGRTAYSVMYLPAGFPALIATVNLPGTQPGLIALTPNAFNVNASQPSYDAIVDRNGVPVYAVQSGAGDFDLKQQPNGEITVFRPTTSGPQNTGADLVTLDDQLQDTTRRRVVAPLTNTDIHDSVRLPDAVGGGTILLGYEPNAGTGKTDATIQKLDPAGQEVFRWTSAPYVAESVMPSTNPDYAHINSVVSVGDDDVIASFRHLSSVYRIATVAHDGYEAGDVIWKLGGRDSTFTFPNDALGGPCAQHTASQLPDGHILIFDNGTSSFGPTVPSLCVDPSDPLGPTVDRNFTRVTEYALDTGSNTATLVWSYPDDPSRYTFFAGSARRLANGNTLIGWAADVQTMATEVDPAGEKIWELTAPDVQAPLQKYATYRAELIPEVPDKIAPTVTTWLAENEVYVVGDTVFPWWSCADRGGSNLASCTGPGGYPRFGLYTGSAGRFSWQVTATDGAGNTSTLVCHYTVRDPHQQPDGLIRNADRTTWKGADVYGAPADQTIGQSIRRGHSGAAWWRVENDGEHSDAFVLIGSGDRGHVKVKYFAGDVDVTRAVVAGTFRTPQLLRGQRFSLRVQLTPTRRELIGRSRTFTLRAWSAATVEAVDRVATQVTVRR